MIRLNSNKIHLNNKGYDFSTFIYTIMIIVYDPIKLEQNPFEQSRLWLQYFYLYNKIPLLHFPRYYIFIHMK